MSLPKTFRELLARYKNGERDFSGAELDQDSEDALVDVCLDGAKFSNAIVVASFHGASLRSVCFRNCNLKTCDFRDADLTGADFSGAALCGTLFAGANVNDAQFESAFYHTRVLARGEKPNW